MLRFESLTASPASSPSYRLIVSPPCAQTRPSSSSRWPHQVRVRSTAAALEARARALGPRGSRARTDSTPSRGPSLPQAAPPRANKPKPRYVYVLTVETGVSTWGKRDHPDPETTTKIFSTMRSANRAAHEARQDLGEDRYGDYGYDDGEDEDEAYHPSSTHPYSATVENSKYFSSTIEVRQERVLGPDLEAGEVDSCTEEEEEDEEEEEEEEEHEGAEEKADGPGHQTTSAQVGPPPLKRARNE